MPKVRLDHLLVSRGLAETRTKAQALVMAGSVRVAGQTLSKPGTLVDSGAEVQVSAGLPYVSRGGYKLAHALDQFGLDPRGLTALDVGASTGGFTDVLLQRGATRVYAVDVGYGILDYRLRADVRVVALERTNIRYLTALPDQSRVACAVIDVAFISLRLVLPAVVPLLEPAAWIVALIKPQFEAGPEHVGKGGVVHDPAIHRKVLQDVLGYAQTHALTLCGLVRSPITGPAGNHEFLAWLQPGGPALDLARALPQVVEQG
ncbi:TlyA family RNA methyltransferase [Candidatus Viridilinea mediisalina]|uniref:TlyA family rRNA (Cytidine-2'-O)-methyltransferase n=1 Tax=Candidatus Viridilinea mediisalina TaxID=2024553 RepID=A0A2A6RN20_9CHLR|nr:TlyA family RNA methyltransferase [Candidatus Viridilinea mediisalina]PDW04269.1 TlyA family rRNA (cytidine-2'-O)-methyltransferase [Candidatus Viridilinea mediisalina]